MANSSGKLGSISGWSGNIADWRECIEDFLRTRARLGNNLEMLGSIWETMESRMVRLESSAASWVNSWGSSGSMKGLLGCSWGRSVNNLERSESMTVKLGNRSYWMVSRMDWLGNKPERLVSNLEKWVSTGWSGSMKGRLENMQGLKGRMVAKESSGARSANSLEMWGSIVVTLGCSWGLLANIVDLLESRLDWWANSWDWSVNMPGRLLLVTQRHSLDCLESTMEMH